MAIQEQVCDRLVEKITTGKPLTDAEKSHLATCEICMAQVVKVLDESATRGPQGLANNGAAANGKSIPSRPEAKRALDAGRKVFQREFGISLPKE